MNDGNTTLAELTFVGPTKTLYNQLLQDCLKVELHQSTFTTKEAEMVGNQERQKKLEDNLAKAKIGVEGWVAARVGIARAQKRQSAAQLAFNNRDKAPADEKDGDVHNMASIISLFQRRPHKLEKWNFKMLFTGDAFERSCSIRNTLDDFVNKGPELVDVLKVLTMNSLYIYIYILLI